MIKIFENPGSDYRDIKSYLHLETAVYQNPYELVTFYDNHDMARMNATDEGFIDANNWLFTSRGIPAVYYGSEIGFMRGTAEHFGNRNYFGQESINAAKSHAIRQHMMRIANVRKESVSLQKGLQLNLQFAGDVASFYRIYQNAGTNQTALVMLNKGNEAARVTLNTMLEPGEWRDAFSGDRVVLAAGQKAFSAEVPAHGIRVFFKDAPLSSRAVLDRARTLMRNRSPR